MKIEETKPMTPETMWEFISQIAEKVIRERMALVEDKIEEKTSTFERKVAEAQDNLFSTVPELRKKANDLIKKHITERSIEIKGEKGDPGADAPVVDEVKLAKSIEKRIRVPQDGVTPKKGVDYFDGEPGTNGSPDMPLDIAKKLNTLDGEVDKKVIKGLTEELAGISASIRSVAARSKKQIAGGGDVVVAGANVTITRTAGGKRSIAATAGGGVSWEIPVGTVDDSNTTFTVANEPAFILVNGGIYRVGNGIYASYAGGTITLASPIGTGGFIVSAY